MLLSRNNVLALHAEPTLKQQFKPLLLTLSLEALSEGALLAGVLQLHVRGADPKGLASYSDLAEVYQSLR